MQRGKYRVEGHSKTLSNSPTEIRFGQKLPEDRESLRRGGTVFGFLCAMNNQSLSVQSYLAVKQIRDLRQRMEEDKQVYDAASEEQKNTVVAININTDEPAEDPKVRALKEEIERIGEQIAIEIVAECDAPYSHSPSQDPSKESKTEPPKEDSVRPATPFEGIEVSVLVASMSKSIGIETKAPGAESTASTTADVQGQRSTQEQSTPAEKPPVVSKEDKESTSCFSCVIL